MTHSRKHRLAGVLVALAAFIATSLGLHALARTQGWNLHHGWHAGGAYCHPDADRPAPGASGAGTPG